MKKTIFCSVILFVMQLSNLVLGVIPAGERTALIALYNSTNGNNWSNNTNWKTPPLHSDGFAMPGTEGNWFGVIVSGDHVARLNVSFNNLTGSIPFELCNLSNLQKLSLDQNLLSGSIPYQLGNLRNLQWLDLSNNQLSGSIPPELGNISNLKQLSLSCNELDGCIPLELGSLTNLQMLELSYNHLSGSIPPGLGNLSIMSMFYLDNNQLSGSIPSELGKSSNLINFVLTGNQLSGGIPSELGNHSNMEYLDLSYNRLSGDIPSSFLNLPRIYTGEIDIRYNCLSTTDPAIIAWLNTYNKGWNSTQNQCGPATIPTITTSPVSQITSTGAVCGGDGIADGGSPIISKGVCWSISTNPTIADSKTTDGYHIISFSSTLTGLKPNTKYYVRAYATNFIGTAYGSDVSFTTPCPPGFPILALSQSALSFVASIAGAVPGPQTVLVRNIGDGVLNWKASGDSSWLVFTPTSGTGDTILSVSIDLTSLEVGYYTGNITITDPQAFNSPQSITVSLYFYSQGQSPAPFVEFDTPLDGAKVSGSIPVTGWALDEIGIENVKIYNGGAYIGDAIFVEGARPDIETAYPTYPNNYKAGWGYMLLTNFLPNGGNGTFTLIAKATDMEGNEVSLGTKTITVDNAHAVKPFGAIDTPTQGGTALGKNYVNYGWVLTPQPNSIPLDGATINISIDGVYKGYPKYNIYRSDIATLFSDYVNAYGAGGYYYIDTTKLQNGLHTIAWIVTDNAGNSDGIGSRYFMVQNSMNSEVRGQDSGIREKRRGEPPYLPAFGLSSPVFDEIKIIEIKELERVEINLSNEGVDAGYLLVGNQLRKLPIGSTLDRDNGIFYWQPGPGFIGEYRFVFIGKDDAEEFTSKNIVVSIKPKQ
jgi:hypothetical protein